MNIIINKHAHSLSIVTLTIYNKKLTYVLIVRSEEVGKKSRKYGISDDVNGV